MSRRSLLSIPLQLHQIKAREISEWRIARGRSGSPERIGKRLEDIKPEIPKLLKFGDA